jgi:transposase
MESITVGIDLAKQVFSVCVMDYRGRVIQRHELKREALRGWLLQLPAGTVVAMEACSGAHYWGAIASSRGWFPG